MKKAIFSVSLIICLMAGMLSVSAQHYWNSNVLNYSVAYGTVNIDGKIDAGEWDDASAISVKLLNDPLAAKGNINYQGEWEAESGRKDSDYQGTYKIKWDENYIYYLEERIDDHVNLAGTGEQPWTTDGVLIFTQVDNDGGTTNPEGISHHIFYSVGNDGAIGGSVMLRICNADMASRETVELEGAKIASALTSKGYLVEIAVPWSMYKKELTGFSAAKAGDTIGLSYVIHDSDVDDTGYVKQMCYAIDNDSLADVPGGYDFGGWGTMKLAAPVVVEKPVETEAPAPEPAQPAAQEQTAVPAPAASVPQTSDNAMLFVIIALAAIGGAAVTARKIRAK